MTRFGTWLAEIGLGSYDSVFASNKIDFDVIGSLTDADLRELGLALGDRKRLLQAVVRLSGKHATDTVIPVVRPPTISGPIREAGISQSGERRQLTVMFCDLVGSTALSEKLDPEELGKLLHAYQTYCGEVIARYDGFVARYVGDGILTYFGWPTAHEEDAERAVRAALEIVHTVKRASSTEDLSVHIGIATGPVVVGEPAGSGHHSGLAVGSTPNLAARLQALAAADQIVIAASTRRLVGNVFELSDLGEHDLKGIAEPVHAWRVERALATESRFDASRGNSALTPLVGRDEELNLLLRRWWQARDGEGQVVLLSGEPGIGKSRILSALRERLEAQGVRALRYQCSPYHVNSAFWPITDNFERTLKFTRDETTDSKLDKLEALIVSQYGRPLADVRFVAAILSIPYERRYGAVPMTPQKHKDETLRSLVDLVEAAARKQTSVMLFEDAHWADPTTLEALDLLIDRMKTAPLLVVLTHRPEFQSRWFGQGHVGALNLSKLTRVQSAAIVSALAGGKAFPVALLDQILTRTDGVPLFVEELTKSILESGLLREEVDRYVLDRGVPPFAIPTSLHASLLARLDRLSSVRLVAQIGAAIGREFSYALLRTVSRLAEDELQAALDRLVASELVFQRGTPPDAVYTFKHALVQDAAHGSLLRSARQQLHAQIAGALEARSPELIDSQPELLAQHYTEAGLVEKSVACWGKAGHRSITRLAMAEAAAQFDKALDQLALLPDDLDRRRQELEFRSVLGAVLRGVKGQAAVETGQAYARARELWEQLGSPSEFLQIPYGQSLYHMVRGELDLAQRLDEDLLRVGRQRDDSVGLVLGHAASGRNLMLVGRFALSRSHLEEGLALYDPISHRSLGHLAGIHPSYEVYLGNVLFCLGFPDQALAQSNAAIAKAQRLAHPQSLAVNLAVSARLLSLLGDHAALGVLVDQLVAVTAEQGFPYWGAQGTIYRGWVKVNNGDVTEGISLLRSGSAAYRATGAEAWMPHYLALLARACEFGGEIEEAFSLLNEALQIVERTGERWFAAELNRHKGQLLLQQGHSEASEQLYRKALSIAEGQEAKVWELRAAASLARLRRDQGRFTEARDFLAPVYGWFTEGFDTKDLQDAKSLLAELR